MNARKRIVIVGATSAIAEHCARIWMQEGPADLTLVGRSAERLERVAKDLQVRSPASDIRSVSADFVAPAAIRDTVADIMARGRIDIVLIAHGSLPSQHACEDDLARCREALEINGISPALYAEAFASHMARADHGTLALISSVAGDRGRKSNYIYGAGKGLVTRYAQGLQHRFAGTGVKVVLIKPGPTDTPMTADLKAAGARLASVEVVAQQITAAIRNAKSTVYTPSIWLFVMLIIRHLPARIFNRLDI